MFGFFTWKKPIKAIFTLQFVFIGECLISTPIPCPVDPDDIVPLNTEIIINQFWISEQKQYNTLILKEFTLCVCTVGIPLPLDM